MNATWGMLKSVLAYVSLRYLKKKFILFSLSSFTIIYLLLNVKHGKDKLNPLHENMINTYVLSEIIDGMKNSIIQDVSYEVVQPATDQLERIPNKIHFIWIGSEVRKEYWENLRTWVNINPNYEVVDWVKCECMSADYFRLHFGQTTREFQRKSNTKTLKLKTFWGRC